MNKRSPSPDNRLTSTRNPALRAARWLVPLMLLLVSALVGSLQAEELDVDRLNAELAERGASWIATDEFLKTLTPEERENLSGGYRWTPEWQAEWEKHLVWYDTANKQLPTNFDWRSQDAVTPVKNQGSCGSCWAFAACAEIESHVLINYGVELDLSEQQIISCNPYGAGCGGGWAAAVYYTCRDDQYGGILEHSRPYAGSDAVPCDQEQHLPFGFVTDWNSLFNDVDQIKTALLNGPVCTSIDGSSLEGYGSGCWDVISTGTDHLVLIVGWDDRLCGEEGAWIIKNSWGSSFGMSGYAYVKYGAGLSGTGCTQAVYSAPGTVVQVTGPSDATDLVAGEYTDVTWLTSGDPASNVDIYWSTVGHDYATPVATNEPNDGVYNWRIPNNATTSGHLVVFPSTGTRDGFGFSQADLTVIGYRTRYVSATGSNAPPYESPATAAHSISDAIGACTGRDSVLVAAGDYLETFTISSTIRVFGGWNADFSTWDPDVYTTNLRGVQSAIRIFAVATEFAGLYDLRFHDCQGGFYADPQPGNHGGAIYSLGGSPTIAGCIFENCQAASGGGYGLGGAILAAGGNPVIEDCLFTGNRATHGGAVALLDGAQAQMRNNRILGNSGVDSTGVSLGGGIYSLGGSLDLEGDELGGNGGVQRGGALYLVGTDLTAGDVILRNNRSAVSGGGAHVDSASAWLADLTVENNTSGSGAGVWISNGDLFMTNTRFDGNTAVTLGGGLMASPVLTGHVENSLFRGNATSVLGGGVLLSANGSYRFNNNIITGNSGGGLVASGASMVADFNVVWNNAGGDYQVGTPGAGDISADPLFVDAAGGDFGLALHTPCLDTGRPEPGCQDPDGSPADVGLLGGPAAKTVAPAAVLGGLVSDLGGGMYRLAWDANIEPDLSSYVVYCDTAEVFVPSPFKSIATVTAPVTYLDVSPGHSCYYLVVAVDSGGHVGGYSARLDVTIVSAVDGGGLPSSFALHSAVPNPFNPRTTLRYDVPERAHVKVGVYDLRGRLIDRLLDAPVAAGIHEVAWNGRDARGGAVAAGVYLVRLEGGGRIITEKIVLAK